MSQELASSIRRQQILLVAVVMALGGRSLLAHDMWIDPTTFLPEPGQIVGVRLRVGQDLIGDPLPRDPSLIDQFIVEDASGRRPLVGRDGADPAGYLRAASSGLLVVGYRSNPSQVQLTAEKFNQYLKEEGLDAVVAARARRNQSGAGAREIFSRCAKSLVLAGPASVAQRDRPLGFSLELMAETNPYASRAGDDLPFRLTYENRPLAGALVVAINRQNPSGKLSARTDADGRVHFTLPRGGMWLVKAVHMVAAPANANADWVSFWASLTFDLGSAEAARTGEGL